MGRVPDDSPESLPSRLEPPRPAYQSDGLHYMLMPPKRCPKCAGCIQMEQIEWHEPYEPKCINCGWRHRQQPELPEEHRGRKSEGFKTGAQLPVVMEVAK